MKFVIIELDVFANSSWRSAIKPPNGSWDEYHAALSSDKPQLEAIDLANMLMQQFFTCIGITRRPEKWRSLTNSWLMAHNVSLAHFLMPDDRDFRGPQEVIPDLIGKSFSESQRRDIAFYIDSNDEMCSMITDLYGISSFCFRRRFKS